MTDPVTQSQQRPANPPEGAIVPTTASGPGQLAARPAPPPREVRVVVSDVLLMDTAKFEQMQRIAQAMAESSIIPDHLVAQPWWDPKGKMSGQERMDTRNKLGPEEFARGMAEAKKRTVANCFLVVEQSFRWGMSPFAVAPETYVVGGKLAYQGKLVLAVVNELAGLDGRLAFDWSGEGPGRTITIRGRFRGEAVERVDSIIWSKVKTDNKMWQADPDQKLLYTGVIHWARRWCPEVVLGVKTVEDAERMIEEEMRALPRSASTLDAFAAAGSLADGGAISVEGAALPDDMRAELSGIPPAAAAVADDSKPGDSAPTAAATPSEVSAPGSLFPAKEDKPAAREPARLSADQVGKLRGQLVGKGPTIEESALVAELDPVAGDLAEILGQEGETADALYNRALRQLRDMKGR